MYNIALQVSQIHQSVKSDELLVKLNAAAVEGLAGIDLVLYDFFPNIPGIYTFRPRYHVPEVETWKDIGAVIRDKAGDCKDLVAWRLAELWRQGVVGARAESIVERQKTRLQFHTFIRLPNGQVEDPARELGMP